MIFATVLKMGSLANIMMLYFTKVHLHGQSQFSSVARKVYESTVSLNVSYKLKQDIR